MMPEAERAFRAALKVEGSHPGLHEGLGFALYQLGHREEAKEQFERARIPREEGGGLSR